MQRAAGNPHALSGQPPRNASKKSDICRSSAGACQCVVSRGLEIHITIEQLLVISHTISIARSKRAYPSRRRTNSPRRDREPGRRREHTDRRATRATIGPRPRRPGREDDCREDNPDNGSDRSLDFRTAAPRAQRSGGRWGSAPQSEREHVGSWAALGLTSNVFRHASSICLAVSRQNGRIPMNRDASRVQGSSHLSQVAANK